MSATKQTTIWCDHPGCPQWTEGPDTMETDTASVRRSARRYGWKVNATAYGHRGRLDYCPAHAKEHT